MFAANRHGNRRAGMFALMQRDGMVRQDSERDTFAFQRFHNRGDDAVFEFGDRLQFEFQVAQMRTFVDGFEVEIDQIMILERLDRGLGFALVIGVDETDGAGCTLNTFVKITK